MKFSIHDLTLDQLKRIQSALDDVFSYTTPQCPTSNCDDDMEVVNPVEVINVSSVDTLTKAANMACTMVTDPPVVKSKRKSKVKNLEEVAMTDEAMLQLMMDLSDE